MSSKAEQEEFLLALKNFIDGYFSTKVLGLDELDFVGSDTFCHAEDKVGNRFTIEETGSEDDVFTLSVEWAGEDKSYVINHFDTFLDAKRCAEEWSSYQIAQSGKCVRLEPQTPSPA